MKFGDYTLRQLFSEIKTSLDHLGANQNLKELHYRPVYEGNNRNVLGRIHNSVMLMCENDYPEFRAYAVSLAREESIFGKIYFDPNGGRAIILGFELFNSLYTINQHCYLASFDKSLTI